MYDGQAAHWRFLWCKIQRLLELGTAQTPVYLERTAIPGPARLTDNTERIGLLLEHVANGSVELRIDKEMYACPQAGHRLSCKSLHLLASTKALPTMGLGRPRCCCRLRTHSRVGACVDYTIGPRKLNPISLFTEAHTNVAMLGAVLIRMGQPRAKRILWPANRPLFALWPQLISL